MAHFSRAVLTDAGVQIARRMMDDELLHLSFTGIASGDGTYTGDEDLKPKTALKSQKQRFGLSSRSVADENVLHLRYILSNVNPDLTPLTTGYYVREIGIYAQLDDEAEALYAIAVADDDTADYLPAYDTLRPSTITMDWFVTVGNTENVTIEASPAAYALASDLEDVDDRKVELSGGDLSDTVVDTVTASTAAYPTISVGDTVKVIIGKISKYLSDLKANKVDGSGGSVSDTICGAIKASAESYPLPSVGDTIKVVIGKISKYLSDLKNNKVDADGGFSGTTTLGSIVYAPTAYTPISALDTLAEVAGKINASFADTAEQLPLKLDADKVANDLVTADAGFVLDARQGRVLNNKVSKIGNYEVVLSTTAAIGVFTAQNASLYLCIIADGGTGAAWICAKKSNAAAGLSQIYNNSGTRFSASVSDDLVTIESAQYGAIILAIKLV